MSRVTIRENEVLPMIIALNLEHLLVNGTRPSQVLERLYEVHDQ
jgi:hypothetical protein